jgi:hypothetical protein
MSTVVFDTMVAVLVLGFGVVCLVGVIRAFARTRAGSSAAGAPTCEVGQAFKALTGRPKKKR